MSTIERFEKKLNVYFALMACLGGLTLSGHPAARFLPVIAVFFATFGLVFVDLLGWFALPSTVAYLCLGGIALHSINRLIDIFSSTPDLQMIAVGELLVLVQAVLMLQRKTRRIYEQLAVFCLLQLIVAAIFNDALIYGLLLLPLGVVGVGGLVLLQIHTTLIERLDARDEPQQRSLTRSPQSIVSLLDAGKWAPRWGVILILPAVIAVALCFFYALPRTDAMQKRRGSSTPLVGFTETVQLSQIGRMLQSGEIAARVDLKHPRTQRSYQLVSDLYLRGVVLERYDPERQRSGTWIAAAKGPSRSRRELPLARPDSLRSGNRPDSVQANIALRSMRGTTLFGIPPHHFRETTAEVMHSPDLWTLQRREASKSYAENAIRYQIGTDAFRDGVQSPFLPRFALGEAPKYVPPLPSPGSSSQSMIPFDSHQAVLQLDTAERFFASEAQRYVELCLQFDDDVVPSAQRIAEQVVSGLDARASDTIGPSGFSDQPTSVEIARALERYLALQGGYEYTLNLTMEKQPWLDPIEQFLAVDRRGHCQYFASALVMMLRSQGIPSRLVVGFSTDEYNSLAEYYVVRQLHAHVWVEALVDSLDLGASEPILGDSPSGQYWMRLDPTPGGGGVDRPVGGRVSEVFGLAQDIWKDYVVDMERTQNRSAGLTRGGEDSVTSSYQLLFRWAMLQVSRVRAGELGGGSLANRDLFSWPAAAGAVLVAVLGIVLYRVGLPQRTGHRRGSMGLSEQAAKPSIEFFAEAIALLERIGIRRPANQTPLQWANLAATALAEPSLVDAGEPLDVLTDAFYRQRFGPHVEDTVRYAAQAKDPPPTANASQGADGWVSQADSSAVNTALVQLRSRVEAIEALPAVE